MEDALKDNIAIETSLAIGGAVLAATGFVLEASMLFAVKAVALAADSLDVAKPLALQVHSSKGGAPLEWSLNRLAVDCFQGDPP